MTLSLADAPPPICQLAQNHFHPPPTSPALHSQKTGNCVSLDIRLRRGIFQRLFLDIFQGSYVSFCLCFWRTLQTGKMIIKHSRSRLDWQPQIDKYAFMSIKRRSANCFTACLLRHVFGFGSLGAKCVLLIYSKCCMNHF